MTGAHLFFALMTTAYILMAIQLEERDLVVAHGRQYAYYRQQVPMLIPGATRAMAWLRRRSPRPAPERG
jgi:protein-S-isoprenylcysteine O-methyltransferase Ste14